MSLRGNCRTLSERIDCSPAIRITRLTTDRQDRPANEEIGEFHQLSSGFGAGLFEGWTSLLTCTAAPGRSLNTPEVTTSSPGLTPDSTATWSPRAAAQLDDLLAHAAVGLAVGALDVLDDEHRIAVGRVVDRRGRQRRPPSVASPMATCASTNIPGRSRSAGLSKVACTCTLRVASSTTESTAVILPAGGCEPSRPSAVTLTCAPRVQLAHLLLRHREVDVDRVERLQRHDRIAGVRGTGRG